MSGAIPVGPILSYAHSVKVDEAPFREATLYTVIGFWDEAGSFSVLQLACCLESPKAQIIKHEEGSGARYL